MPSSPSPSFTELFVVYVFRLCTVHPSNSFTLSVFILSSFGHRYSQRSTFRYPDAIYGHRFHYFTSHLLVLRTINLALLLSADAPGSWACAFLLSYLLRSSSGFAPVFCWFRPVFSLRSCPIFGFVRLNFSFYLSYMSSDYAHCIPRSRLRCDNTFFTPGNVWVPLRLITVLDSKPIIFQ